MLSANGRDELRMCVDLHTRWLAIVGSFERIVLKTPVGIYMGSVASLTNLRGSRFTLRIATLKYKTKYQHKQQWI